MTHRTKCFIALGALFFLAACGRGGKGKTLARIDGKAFTEGDLALRLASVGEERRDAVLADPAERRKEFHRILKSHVYALAAKKEGYAKDPSLSRRLVTMDQRVATQYYFETHLDQRGGLLMKDIEAYYRANASKFADDSGRTLPLARVVSRAADSLQVSRANLDSFYQTRGEEFRRKASCDISVIQTAKRGEADKALKALQEGMPWADAVAKYSTHPSKESQGRISRVMKDEVNPDLGSAAPADSLFFNPESRLKPGQVGGPVALHVGFMLVRPDSCREAEIPPLASVRQQVVEDYLRQVKIKLRQDALANLKAKYQVRMVNPVKAPTEKEIQDYYEAHKESYRSPETFELYHIEVAKKEKAAGRAKSVKDLEGFKALAGQISENAWTRAQGGLVGSVKRDFSLPYGIGMLPALFPALDAASAGLVPEPVESGDTRKWHFFWLAGKQPGQIKSLERVKILARQDVEANRIASVQPEDTLAVIGDGRVVREDDVNFLKEEIPPHVRERFTRENLVDYLLTWQLATDECKALGLVREEGLVAARIQNEDGYWERVFQDSVLLRHHGEDTALLARTFTEKHGLFTRDSSDRDWRKHIRDVAGYLSLTSRDFDIEYHTNPERYMRDTVVQAREAADYDIFQNLRMDAQQRAENRYYAKLKEKFRVRVLDPALEETVEAAEGYAKAQSLHYDRKLDEALALYEKLRTQYPDRAGLQDSVCFGIAQIYIEQERFQQAMAEYRRVTYLYPESQNNYKAMFMVGFIQSEHLRNDSAAVRSFERMLAKYPKSDLSDDADWMIRNIRSGGKLMPVLEGDSTWTAPDSAGTAAAAAPAGT